MSFRGRQHTSLGSLIDDLGGSIQTGPFGTVLQAAEYRNAGIPLISVRELVDGRIVIDERTPRVGNATLERLPTYILKVGDIVFGRKGAVERAAIITDRENGWFLGSDGIRVRLGSAVNARFVHYQVRSPRVSSWLIQHAGGTTMASMNQKILRQLPIVVPSLSEQKAIASILGALDDKINLNRRMNETLESMARVLYKSWFVDFDPVVAKAAGKRPFGMDDATAALFPNRFVDSDLGPIPEGWELSNVGSIAEFPRETMDPTELSPETPYVGLEHIPRRSLFLTDMGSAVDVSSGKLAFRDQDLLFGKLRPYFHKVVVAQSYGVCSTDIVVVRSIFPDDQAFVWFTLFADQFVDYATAVSGGTRMPRVRWQDMSQYPLVLPPDRIRRSFNQQVKRLIELGHNNVDESQTLAELRDLLLPKLISGEVRIKDAEKAVGEVV